MSTDLGSLDQFIPNSQAETFARQLQSRLRSLSNESTGEGSEDTNWNGDQLSSSSENDVYYDLESCPSSPAEEALESDFSNYINTEPNGTDITRKICQNSTIFNEPLFSLYSNEPPATSNGQQECNCCQDNQLHNLELQSNQGRYSRNNDKAISNGKGPPISLASPSSSILNNSSQCSSSTSHHSSNGFTDLRDESLNREISNHLHLNKVSSIEKFTIDNYSENHTNECEEKYSSNNGIDIPTTLEQGKCSFYSSGAKGKSIACSSIPSNNITNNGIYEHDVNQLSNNRINHKENHNGSRDTCEEISDKCISPLNSTSNESQKNKRLSLEEDIFENNNTILLSDSIVTESDKTPPVYSEEALAKLVDTVFSSCKTEEIECVELIPTSVEDAREKYIEEEEESIEIRRLRFRRSSSLKTGKTPPSTPCKKKIVRFADVLGLDLADVRTFMDEVPKVPKSAFVDLKGVELSSSPLRASFLDFVQQAAPPSQNQKSIVPLFEQPSCHTDFLDRVRDDFVCLENAMISDAALSTITGVVRVRNVDFQKSVYIRYSIDSWKSFADLQARYVPNSCDGLSDKFSFVLYAHMLNVGQKMEFAVRFQARGCQYWDNNKGANYIFQCLPGGHTKQNLSLFIPPSPIETWASFY